MNIADHAERILPTLAYAKAQNNNHLVSEAVGLYTAGVFLPHHPRAGKWKETGLLLFTQAINTQVSADGEYIQHSTNYHRMLLMLSLWMWYLMRTENKDLDNQTNKTTRESNNLANWTNGLQVRKGAEPRP